ncbi:MAG: bifunctional adenosylcobinamide kinase/adenosylcobinamide-phosphate guanylyltransferase [Chloroflexi bacterium]|nr:bifunctional adenosylcobinamide kinase/adenosylcobinamide-phosphate guanylyltransferase [Chloroflexota bacterium]
MKVEVGELTLITGGARSGKSSFAERLAMQGERALFVATAEPLDDDMTRRIAAHKASRPAEWDTLEEPLALPDATREYICSSPTEYDTIIIDCLTMWVSNLLLRYENYADCEARIVGAAKALLDVYASDSGNRRWIIVTNEVGLGIVPSSSLGRAYRDSLGRVNSLVASCADRVYLMAAGLALDLKTLGARHINDIGDTPGMGIINPEQRRDCE